MTENIESPTNPNAEVNVNLSNRDTGKYHALANRDQRLMGVLIDGVIVGPSGILFLCFVFGGWEPVLAKVQSNSIRFQLMGLVTGLIIYLLVNGYLLAKHGQTVGKKIVGIRIVRTDGTPAKLMHIIAKRFLPVQICSFIPLAGNFLILIDILLIFRKTRKCLHDQIADTIVVVAG